MNTLQVKKYCFLIKVESQNKLRLLITLQEKFLNNKEKQLKSNQKKKKKKSTEQYGNKLAEPNVSFKKYNYDIEKDSPSFLGKKETFNKLIERRDKILKLSKKINCNDLKCHCKSKINEKRF